MLNIAIRVAHCNFVIMSCAIVISESATVRAGDPRARSCAQIYYHVRWAYRFYCFANFRVADNACPTTAGDMKAPNPFADTKLAGWLAKHVFFPP